MSTRAHTRRDWTQVYEDAKKLILTTNINPTFESIARQLGIPTSSFGDGMRGLGVTAQDFIDLRPPAISQTVEDEKSTMDVSGENMRVVLVGEDVKTIDDAVRIFGINLGEWEPSSKMIVKCYHPWRKDRQVKWVVRDGIVVEGDVNDTGNIVAGTLYSTEFHFVRKTAEIRAKNIGDEVLALIRENAKPFPAKAPRRHGNLLLEINMPDVHFGRLTWEQETGENYDIKIAGAILEDLFTRYIGLAKEIKPERIVFVLGNDFFNVEGASNATTNQTPQDEDTRHTKTFMAATTLLTAFLESIAKVAPVDVLTIQGNHDEERTFYLALVLEAYFHKHPEIRFDNQPTKRKYFQWGKSLLGVTHIGKMADLPQIMAVEVPNLWGQTRHREFHIAHLHHQKEQQALSVNEKLGCVVRLCRSIAAPDIWTHSHGFVGSIRGAEIFVWDKEYGLVRHEYINLGV